MRNLKPLNLSVFFFACERTLIKTYSIESRCYRTGKYTVCRRVRTSFGQEILQAGAMKGLADIQRPVKREDNIKVKHELSVHKYNPEPLLVTHRFHHQVHLTYRQYKPSSVKTTENPSSGAVWESRWPSWAVRPNEPSGFRGRKAILNHANALVSACP